MRHSGPVPLPAFPLRSLDDLAACAPWIHEDRCSWMGEDAEHPCTCGIPVVIRRLAMRASAAVVQPVHEDDRAMIEP